MWEFASSDATSQCHLCQMLQMCDPQVVHGPEINIIVYFGMPFGRIRRGSEPCDGPKNETYARPARVKGAGFRVLYAPRSIVL